MSLNTE
jgi:hypothetical protein